VAGYRVIMTREDDRSIHSQGSDTVRQQKVSDIHNRFKIIQQNPNAIFISIHQNKFPKSQYSGTQVFFSANNPDSSTLAQFIQSTVKNMLQPDNTREIKPAGSNLYLLYHAKSPAVLVECGFLSNPNEAALLMDNTYENKMAFTIFSGTINYYSDLKIKTGK
jgi:N-acetylmuramoyl-L-alanine amidase